MFDYITLILLNPVNISRFFNTKKDLKIFLVLLNLIYAVISIAFVCNILYEINDLKFSIGSVLVFIQLIIPQILQFYLAFHFIRDKNIQLTMKIHQKLIQNSENGGLMWLKIKFIVQISIVIGIQLSKLAFVTKFFNIAYCFCIIIPDTIRCGNDFVFTYHVDVIKCQIKNSLDDVNFYQLTPELLKKYRNKITEYSKMCNMLTKLHSSKLLLTITYNFVLLIISFYWIFVRLAFNHFESFETFLYLFQPLLSILTVFHSCHKCFVMVS